MKKQILLIVTGGVGLFLFLSLNQNRAADDGFPEEIDAILASSCFGCHNSEARSDDAKKAVQFDLWDDYRVIKKIGILGEIEEVMEEGKMPPPKFLENNPEKGLTAEQRKLLLDWAKQESGRLMEGN
jgi:hypothetical protein